MILVLNWKCSHWQDVGKYIKTRQIGPLLFSYYILSKEAVLSIKDARIALRANISFEDTEKWVTNIMNGLKRGVISDQTLYGSSRAKAEMGT